ncbi:MAG: circadian clock KaiB family protein [Phycisphaerae bacterium]
MSSFKLRLFIAGKTDRSERAVANVRRICEKDLRDVYELEIIDVIEQPDIADQEKIMATPTLIKQLPPPLRRIVGDLSDTDKVLRGLNLIRMD